MPVFTAEDNVLISERTKVRLVGGRWICSVWALLEDGSHELVHSSQHNTEKQALRDYNKAILGLWGTKAV